MMLNDMDEMDSDSSSDVSYLANYDLAGYAPSITDAHGIRMLLNIMFRDLEIDMNGVILAVTAENNIGSVLKPESIEEYENDEDGNGAVYSLTTALNMSHLKDEGFVKTIVKYIKESAEKYSTEETKIAVHEIMSKFDESLEILGFLITERMINIPHAALLTELRTLNADLKVQAEADNRFNFTKFVRFIRMYKKPDGEMVYFNSEDRVLDPLLLHFIDIPIDTDKYGFVSTSEGDAGDAPVEYPQYRRVGFVGNDYLDKAVIEVEKFVSTLGGEEEEYEEEEELSDEDNEDMHEEEEEEEDF